MLDEISTIKPKKCIEPKRSISVNITQLMTQNDASKFLNRSIVTNPIDTIAKLKFLTNSSPIICKIIMLLLKLKNSHMKDHISLTLLADHDMYSGEYITT